MAGLGRRIATAPRAGAVVEVALAGSAAARAWRHTDPERRPVSPAARLRSSARPWSPTCPTTRGSGRRRAASPPRATASTCSGSATGSPRPRRGSRAASGSSSCPSAKSRLPSVSPLGRALILLRSLGCGSCAPGRRLPLPQHPPRAPLVAAGGAAARGGVVYDAHELYGEPAPGLRFLPRVCGAPLASAPSRLVRRAPPT